MQSAALTAGALADETRLRLLAALVDGEATVSDLAARLGLAQPRVSTQLAILRHAGLVAVEAAGRSRTYRADPTRGRTIVAALRVLASPRPRAFPKGLAPGPSARAVRELRRNSTIRQARSCYDHLAGVAGVGLLDALLRRGWLTRVRPAARVSYVLTRPGIQAMRGRGVDLDRAHKARRLFAYGCVDWTERRPHLGGALGAAILDALVDAGVVRRRGGSRALALRRPVASWLGARR